MLLSEGQMSDYKGAALMIDALPPARQLLADKRYDADWFRRALAERGIMACIPSKSNRKRPIEHDRELYRQRHKIENMFGRLKDWRCIATRYDRCAHPFMCAICIAATVSSGPPVLHAGAASASANRRGLEPHRAGFHRIGSKLSECDCVRPRKSCRRDRLSWWSRSPARTLRARTSSMAWRHPPKTSGRSP